MDTETRILVIDDEEGIRDWLLFELEGQGYHVDTARNGKEGLNRVKKNKFDIAIIDIKMPGMDGIEVLEEIKKIDPYIEVIISTGYGTIELAIESIRKGACNYITKPNSLDEITVVIEKAMELRRLKETLSMYRISKVVFSTLETDSLSRISVNLAQKVMKSEGASLMLFNGEKKLYQAASSGGFVPDSSVAERILKDLKPVLFNDNFSMAVPLIEEIEPLGVLLINRTKAGAQFTEKDQEMAVLFASLVALAVKNAGIFSRLKAYQNGK